MLYVYICVFVCDRAGHRRGNPQRRAGCRVWLSWRQALAHLKVSVHDVMLVNMIDTLQDLTDALAEKQNNKSVSGRETS